MEPSRLEILYEDASCLAVNKPAGLLTQGDRTGDKTIIDLVRGYLAAERGPGRGRPFAVPVHRLDRPVSGALLMALKTKTASRMALEFKGGRVRKVYWALVEGRPAKRNMSLAGWMVKDRRTNTSRLVKPDTPGAVPAQLRLRVLESCGALTLLEVQPLTGRSHQIRVQLSAIGCPVTGDVRYGSSKPLGGMIALHCRSMTFTHPVSGEDVHVCAPLPGEWKRLLKPGG